MLDFGIPSFIASTYELARLAPLIVRDVSLGGVQFSFCNIAVAASADGVRVVVREGLLLLSWIESEDAPLVACGGLLSALHSLVVRCLRVLGLAHLYGRTAAVPSIWRVVGLPEGV